MSIQETTQRPFLRWAGSKRKLIPRLRKFWLDDDVRYVEPFAGSACLFFSINPQKAILGDNNAELINTYKEVKKAPEEIHRRLVHIPRNESTYYRWRAKKVSDLDTQSRALRFLYLNHNCFNGIYRTNSAGDFNVPFGSKLARYLTRDEFVACALALRNVQFVSGDFEKSLQHVRTGDFVYLDPPYALNTRRVFREYGQKSFQVDDVTRLATALETLNSKTANFVVSYADCPQSRQLARKWNSVKISVRRHIAGFTDHRTSAYEWLITNMAITISDNLAPLALKVAEAMRSRGYKVRCEPKDISLPATPTLVAKRAPETVFIFVAEGIALPELKTWIKFCGANPNDSRIAICVEDAGPISVADLAAAQRDGLGVGAMIDGEFKWVAEPRDIAFHVSLPERQTLSPRLRVILGEAFDRFEQRDWRAGFESACLALEEEGRKYLLKNQPIGRTGYKRGNRLVTPTRKDINKMTLGALAFVFCNLVRQNQVEAQLCSALDRLNPSRIHRVHKARRARSETVLRRHVGAQMWLIINALNVIPR